jgi:hypothetical protein
VTAGTLGLWVRRGQGSERYALSNNHVLAASNEATPGDFIRQPGRADEVVLEEWVATPVPTIGEPAGIRDFQLGDRVQKTGRTTEHTRGLVETVGAQVQVDCGTGTATYDDRSSIASRTSSRCSPCASSPRLPPRPGPSRVELC